MVPVALRELAPAYYVGTTHKWVCAPKGTTFLFVRRDMQARIRPLSISSGADDTRTDRSRFRLEFDWTGTCDPTGWLTIPAAIERIGGILTSGWPALRSSNRQLAIAARRMLAETLQTALPAPDSMIGSMAAVRLPGGPWPRAEAARQMATIEAALRSRQIEVPLMVWPCPWLVDSGDLPESTEFELLVRISAQAYNHFGQYERLASVLSGVTTLSRAT